MRNRFKTLIPPPVYLLFFATLMWLLNCYFPLYQWLEMPWRYAGLVLIVLAGLSDLWSLSLFLKLHTTPNPMRPSAATHLVTTGLYRYSRNPMYMGMLVMLIGWWIWLGSITPILMLPIFILVLVKMQIEPEEEALEARFGDTYRHYKNSVPRWF
ncbi:MAG: isoprenylcysteine carboxylmethyltransferase family protein [Oceanospirillales bacterium]|nr:MAG: isoprenylcysteine carboxylmethyltransferase family protein [Oceanospirillales bacterium]